MAGLLDALKQFIGDSLPGGSLNQEQPQMLSGLLDAGKQKVNYLGGMLDPNSPISRDATNWHKKTQLGLADLLAGREGPAADYGYQQMMNMTGMAPVGMVSKVSPEIIKSIGNEEPAVLASKIKGLLSVQLGRQRSLSERIASGQNGIDSVALNTDLVKTDSNIKKLHGWLMEVEPPINH